MLQSNNKEDFYGNNYDSDLIVDLVTKYTSYCRTYLNREPTEDEITELLRRNIIYE